MRNYRKNQDCQQMTSVVHCCNWLAITAVQCTNCLKKEPLVPLSIVTDPWQQSRSKFHGRTSKVKLSCACAIPRTIHFNESVRDFYCSRSPFDSLRCSVIRSGLLKNMSGL